MQITESRRSVGHLTLNIAETDGTAPALVMFHGVTQRWQTFLPLIPVLSQRHRLMLVDARGHGTSDRADSYFVTDYVSDAIALVRQLDRPVAVYGHSLGAMVAAGVAAECGDQITAAVMEDPPLHAMGKRIGETHLLNYFKVVSTFAGSSVDAGDLADQAGASEFHNPVTNRTMRLADMRNPIQRRFSASCWKQLDPQIFDTMLAGRWLDGYDVDSVFASIVCPSLLLQADVPAGGMLTDTDAQHIESLNSRLIRIPFPGVGHTLHMDATQALLNTVCPFLETVPN